MNRVIRHMKEDEYTPEHAQAELLALVMKAGRRCAYDLKHAADVYGPSDMQKTLHRRAEHWIKVFNPADDQKNYRHDLHRVIDGLEEQVAGLLALCKKNNIDPGDFDDSIF